MNELRDKKGLTEAEAIAAYRKKNYPKPALTADICIFAKVGEGWKLLLIRRGGHPYLGCWALPGGFADQGETIEQTAARELEEETGLSGIPMRLVGVYSAPGRDPRGWTVTAAYVACLPQGTLRAIAADESGFVCEEFQAAPSTLTARELDVLREVASGKQRDAIAATLGIGPESVKTHLKGIMTKLNCPNATSAVSRAYELGILRA
jgi:ADP-ribose pyrophosphatase YjhB (NUDIX family)